MFTLLPLKVIPFVAVRLPPVIVNGFVQLTLLTKTSPSANCTPLPVLMVTSSVGAGRLLPLQFSGLLQRLSPPLPVQVLVPAWHGCGRKAAS